MFRLSFDIPICWTLSNFFQCWYRSHNLWYDINNSQSHYEPDYFFILSLISGTNVQKFKYLSANIDLTKQRLCRLKIAGKSLFFIVTVENNVRLLFIQQWWLKNSRNFCLRPSIAIDGLWKVVLESFSPSQEKTRLTLNSWIPIIN